MICGLHFLSVIGLALAGCPRHLARPRRRPLRTAVDDSVERLTRLRERTSRRTRRAALASGACRARRFSWSSRRSRCASTSSSSSPTTGTRCSRPRRRRKALDLVEREQPDLVLLDAVLPDASGFERLLAPARGRAGALVEPRRAGDHGQLAKRAGRPPARLRARAATTTSAMPFMYEELVARMRAVLRRAGGPRRTRALAIAT